MPSFVEYSTLFVNSSVNCANKLVAILLNLNDGWQKQVSIITAVPSALYSMYTRHTKLNLDENDELISYCKSPLLLSNTNTNFHPSTTINVNQPLLKANTKDRNVSFSCPSQTYRYYEQSARGYIIIIFFASLASCSHLWSLVEPIKTDVIESDPTKPINMFNKILFLLGLCALPAACTAYHLYHYKLNKLSLNSPKLWRYIANSSEPVGFRILTALVLALNGLGYGLTNYFFGKKLLVKVIESFSQIFNFDTSPSPLLTLSYVTGTSGVILGLPITISNTYKFVKLLDSKKLQDMITCIKMRSVKASLLLLIIAACNQFLSAFSCIAAAKELNFLPDFIIILSIISQTVSSVMFDADIHFPNTTKISRILNQKVKSLLELDDNDAPILTLSPHFTKISMPSIVASALIPNQLGTNYNNNTQCSFSAPDFIELITSYELDKHFRATYNDAETKASLNDTQDINSHQAPQLEACFSSHYLTYLFKPNQSAHIDMPFFNFANDITFFKNDRPISQHDCAILLQTDENGLETLTLEKIKRATREDIVAKGYNISVSFFSTNISNPNSPIFTPCPGYIDLERVSITA